MTKIIVPGVKKTKLTEFVESSSEPGIFYKVSVYSDNTIHCECPAIKECKHIKSIKKKYKIND
jgi:hypothetical protein